MLTWHIENGLRMSHTYTQNFVYTSRAYSENFVQLSPDMFMYTIDKCTCTYYINGCVAVIIVMCVSVVFYGICRESDQQRCMLITHSNLESVCLAQAGMYLVHVVVLLYLSRGQKKLDPVTVAIRKNMCSYLFFVELCVMLIVCSHFKPTGYFQILYVCVLSLCNESTRCT